MSSGVFMLLASADTTRMRSPEDLAKKAFLPFSLKGPAEMRANLSFSQGQLLFFSCMRRLSSCLGVLGVSAFLKMYFYFIYYIHSHCNIMAEGFRFIYLAFGFS